MGRPHPDLPAGERYFFVHCQKTAGTSLKFRLTRLFGREAVYPSKDDHDGPIPTAVLMPDHLAGRLTERGDTIRVITGHFPLCVTDYLGGGFKTFTVLREPVERTLSYLRHHRQSSADDADKTLEEIYEDPFRFDKLIHNHMVKMFSLTAEEMTEGTLTEVDFGPERLARAKEGLASIDVVGVQEEFETFCDDLTRTFGWPGLELVDGNKTSPTEVSDAFRGRIAADNADDIELHRFAQTLAAERRPS